MPHDDVPEWFRAAMAAPVEVRTLPTPHGDTRVAVRGTGGPALVLVHGGSAHLGWWDHIAPLLAQGRRVIALDLAGHGDSEWRPPYSVDGWAEQVMAVARRFADDGPPILVGHSMGGFVTLRAGALFPDELRAVVTVDTAVTYPTPEQIARRRRLAARTPRVYPTLTEALGRFRTVPDQPGNLPWVVEHIARGSLRQVDGGYTWKFDSRVYDRPFMTPDELAPTAVPTALIRPEHGLATREVAGVMAERLGARAVVIPLPATGHHAMLDQPLALVAALNALVSTW